MKLFFQAYKDGHLSTLIIITNLLMLQNKIIKHFTLLRFKQTIALKLWKLQPPK